MVEVKIDGVPCDFQTEESIALAYSCTDLVDLESGREGSTVKFILPLNATNVAIFGVEGDVHAETKFNTGLHSMSIVMDGLTIYEGTAYLMQSVWGSDENYLEVECRGGAVAWADSAADTLFKEIAIDYSDALTEANIKASWESDSPIKFFPIVRDSYEDEGASSDVTGVRLLRSIDDYHPFIQISALFDAIFTSAGYSVSSSTIGDELFSELYMSGDYSSAENEAAAEYMGFYIKRAEDCSTTTDTMGRISLSPYDGVNTVGNLVDMSTLESDSECYNYGGCLQVDNEAVIYKPLTSISVGFEYYLHYTCDCSIESRSTLKGIDRLNTIDNGSVSWEITNRNIDQRDNISSGISYKLFIFDFESGGSFRLYSLDSSGATLAYYDLSTQATSVTFSSVPSSLVLYQYVNGTYITYDSDWALYFGYVELVTSTEIKITVRSAPKTYSPTSPMEFEFQLLEGADAGVDFTLHSDTSIRPYFSAYPGYNSDLTFETIGQHSFSALDFLTAMQHLFNLRFSTNEAAKMVTIESFDNFYNGFEWDWSDKVIEDEPIEFVDWAHSTHRLTTYGYQQTDGVVQRMGETDNKYFGEWSYEVDSYAASSSDQTLLNPIFSASTNDENGVLVVGDRDDLELVNSLSFSPRIVRYFGQMEIDDENYSLPYVAFHNPDEGFTLCFEDRDDTEGLNRLYQSEVELLRRSQIISLSLNLSALDYSNLFEPHADAASLRSRFYFELHGESFKTILYGIESFNPVSGVAKCSFLTIN